MHPKRVVAGLSIVVTGLGILTPTARVLVAGTGSLVGLIVAGFGAVLGLLLLAGGGWIARSDLDGDHALRVAGWNLLGVVALGSVLLLVTLYPGATLPFFVAAVIMGVSAVAHILIGINDVRRIRAGELAREREKLAVLNRLTRHNLRNDTQVVIGLADVLADRADDPETAEIVDRLRRQAADLAGIGANLKQFQQAIEHDAAEDEPLALAPLVEAVRDERASAHPDATIDVDVPDGLDVRADDHLSVALDHLVENAVEYADGDAPDVDIEARANGGGVDLRVVDDGPGIGETERAIVTGEQDITQLEHGSGLGLWVVKAIAESYGGELDVAADDGTTVTMRLPSA